MCGKMKGVAERERDSARERGEGERARKKEGDTTGRQRGPRHVRSEVADAIRR